MVIEYPISVHCMFPGIKHYPKKRCKYLVTHYCLNYRIDCLLLVDRVMKIVANTVTLFIMGQMG